MNESASSTNNIGTTSKSNYRPEIDGLRAIAVIAVIINHFNKGLLPSGYLGVDIFFIISGYVITSSLANRSHKSFGDFLLGFYTRRIKRLMPALIVCVVITCTVAFLFIPPEASEYTTAWHTGVTALFGFSNLYLFNQSTYYFGTAVELNAFTQTWSLGVEEQFYALFPFLVWFSGFGKQAKHGYKILLWLTVFLSLTSLIVYVLLNQTNQSAAYFLMPSRLWELGSGCLLFLGLDRSSTRFLTVLQTIRPVVTLGLITALFFTPLAFSVQATILVVILTVILIACLRPQTSVYSLLTQPGIVFIGLISYSLYLWHWSVLVISRLTIGFHWWSIPIQLGLILLLAIGSYHYVEQPLRHATWSHVRWKTIGYGLGASACAASLLVGLGKPLKGKLYSGTDISEKMRSSPLLKSWDSGANAAYLATVKKRAETCNMTPQYLAGSDHKPKPVVDQTFIRECAQSLSNTSSNKLLLVGDSFAQVSTVHLAVMAKELGLDFKSIYGYSCPYPLSLRWIKSATRSSCPDANEQLLQDEVIGSLRRGDILVIRLYLPKPQYVSYSSKDMLPPVDAYDEALLRLSKLVKEKGAYMILIGANPTLTFDEILSAYPQWFYFNKGGTVKQATDPETQYYLAQESHLMGLFPTLPNASYFSLRNQLCMSDNVCYLSKDGVPLYADSQHLTPYAHDLFFDDLKYLIKGIRQNLATPGKSLENQALRENKGGAPKPNQGG